MLKNYIKIIQRNLTKAPVYFFINLFGLGVGMAACLVLLHYAQFESNYDTFHKNAENKYRLLLSDEGGISATTPAPLGAMIKEQFSQIKDYVMVRDAVGILRSEENGKIISDNQDKIVTATDRFFEMFDFKLKWGNTEKLAEPYFVFISENLAYKYFNEAGKDVLGKQLVFFDNNFGKKELSVAGILENPPGKTHLPVEAVISMRTIENNDQFWAKFDNFGWIDFYTYLELNEGAVFTQQERNEFIDGLIGKENRERAQIEIRTQPLADIHLDPNVMNSYQRPKDGRIISFLKIVGVFILFMACVNYVNLAGARSLKRAREVGVRKNFGATKMDIVKQFVFESAILGLLSIILAITLLQLIWPILEQGIGNAFKISFWSSVSLSILWPVLVGLLWIIIHPALVVASFPMIQTLKGNISGFGKGKLYRKASVVTQFAISLTLMITSYVIYKQINLFQNKDLGMNIDQKLIVNRPKEDVENYGKKAIIYKEKLRQLSMVDNVSLSGSVPGYGYNYSTNNIYQKELGPNEEGEYGVNITYIDDDFVSLYNIPVIAGQAKYKGEAMNPSRVVINRKALVPLKFSSPEQAVGKVLIHGEESFEIIGVIEDYQHNSVKSSGQPALFRLEPNAQYFTIAFNTGSASLANTEEILIQSQKLYNDIFPDTNFTYSFLDEDFAAQYRYERFFASIILVFTSLAIVLAVLGLFGLSLFSLERKTKEIGIRKTLGAGAFSLFVNNVLPFAKMLLIASLAAIPFSYWLTIMWLADYEFKIDLGALNFILPVILLSIIALLTISHHLLKLNRTNPVESLRYE